MYYDMDGNPISLMEWSHIYSNADRTIGSDVVIHGEHIVRVSTVYLGLDHSFFGGIPLIFETMMFSTDESIDQGQWRYATKEQAIRGHADVLAQVTKETSEHDKGTTNRGGSS